MAALEKPVLSPSLLSFLADNNPIGMRLEPRDVAAWFDLVWPQYSTHNYKRHRRAVVSWWSRVQERDIERARERAGRMKSEARAARIARDIAERGPDTDAVPDFFGRLNG